MADKHKKFAETMRNIMLNNVNDLKRTELNSSDDDLDEETRSLQELLEAKFDELFGPMEDEDEE